VPGDAAISERAAILGALAAGTTVITDCAQTSGVQRLLRCLEALGVAVERRNGTIAIEGAGGPGLAEPDDVLDCGSSTATMRLLAGVLAGQPFLSVLSGDPVLRRRPMRRVLEPLARMGARTWGRDHGCHAPIVIHGGMLEGLGRYRPVVASEQVKSCLLVAGLAARGETAVIEPAPTRDHTERLIPLYGGTLALEPGGVIRVRGPQSLRGASVKVPGDFSLAAAWLVLAAAAPSGSELTVTGVGLNPRRTALLGVLERMGAAVDVVVQASDPEPVGSVRVRGGELRGVEVDRNELPALLDELPLLAVAAAMARGRTVIRGAGNIAPGGAAGARISSVASNLGAMGAAVAEQGGDLSHNDGSRLSMMVRNLRAMAVRADDTEDGLVIVGGGELPRGGRVQANGEPRLAIALAVAGALAEGETLVDDLSCAATSYPRFAQELHHLSRGKSRAVIGG